MVWDSNKNGQADQEAARWFARLNSASVSTADLSAFHDWRRDADHDAAYRRVEHVWQQSQKLAGDPIISDALAGAHRRARSRRAFKRLWPLVPVGVLAAALGVTVFVEKQRLAPRAYATAIGQQRLITLPDGTHVRLDTDSQIQAQYSARQRAVTLVKGRAYFDVVHNASRPFSVVAGNTVIDDLGTRFEVREREGAVQVTLVQGSVTVEQAGSTAASWRLTPGQQVTTGAAPAAPKAVDVSATTSWTSGRLIFNDVSLEAAVTEVNRYARQRIVLASGDVGAMRVSGAFNTSDPQGFVSAVVKLYDLNAHSQADGSILLTGPIAPKTT